MVIILDFDDVCVDFMQSFCKYHNEKYGTNLISKELVNYDLSILELSDSDTKKRIEDFHHSTEFKNMPIIDGAKAGIEELHKLGDIIVISYRDKCFQKQTEEQAEKHFPGLIKKVICNGVWATGGEYIKKAQLAKQHGAIMAVDDGIHHVEGYADHNIPALLFTRPWNKHHTCKHKHIRVSSWKEIVEHAKKIKKK